MAAPAATITGDELATRLDALRVEIDTLTDAAYQLSYDADPGTASVCAGLHSTRASFSATPTSAGFARLKSRLRHPATTAKDKP